MPNSIQTFVFSLYERRVFRNWFYTLAFAIFVPVGLRFATLAWEFGGHFDRVMAVVAGIAVGVTTLVTLMRIWAVPPRQTVEEGPARQTRHVPSQIHTASEIADAARLCSARNRMLARDARALGAPHHFGR